MTSTFLVEVHEVATEDEDWNAGDEEHQTDSVQQGMNMVVEQPACRKHKSDHQGDACDYKTHARRPRLPGDPVPFFAHETNLRPGA